MLSQLCFELWTCLSPWSHPRFVPRVLWAEKVMRADGSVDKWRWWHRRTQQAPETEGERGNNVVKEMTMSIKWNWRSSQQMVEQRMWPAKLLVALQARIDGYVQSQDKKGGRVGMTDAQREEWQRGEGRDSEMRGRKWDYSTKAGDERARKVGRSVKSKY